MNDKQDTSILYLTFPCDNQKILFWTYCFLCHSDYFRLACKQIYYFRWKSLWWWYLLFGRVIHPCPNFLMQSLHPLGTLPSVASASLLVDEEQCGCAGWKLLSEEVWIVWQESFVVGRQQREPGLPFLCPFWSASRCHVRTHRQPGSAPVIVCWG